jgi:hypothetical protein
VIVSPTILKLIQQRKATQICLPVRLGEKKCGYRRGHAYKVRVARGESPVTITVTDVRPEPKHVGAITLQDIRKSGFRTRADYLAHWQELHASESKIPSAVWVVSLVCGDARDVGRYLAAFPPKQFCAAILPNGKRCGRGFRDKQDVCKCGRRRPEVSEDDIGYTTTPSRGVRGERQAVDATVQERYTQEAHVRHAVRRRQTVAERADLLPAERLHLVEQESRRLGIDISSESRLIAQRVDRAERQCG